MDESTRIDIEDPSDTLVQLLTAEISGIHGVDYILTDKDEYKLSGREIAKFLAITIISGIVGNTAHDISKVLFRKIILFIGEQVEQTRQPISIIIDGIRHRVLSRKSADLIILDHDSDSTLDK